ncbi:TPA: phosphoglycerate kinase [bacterium]|nr:phosphoglycerate kinase [bacterium]
MGGAKISTKIKVIKNLLGKVDILMIGGAMACIFLRAQGFAVGKSLIEEENVGVAREILSSAMEKGTPIVLPIDCIVAQEFKEESPIETVYRSKIPPEWGIVDIGHVTVDEFSKILEGAQTILWNGPVGIFEIDKFARGTEKIARILSTSKATTIIGGGDSVAAVNKFALADKMAYVSTGGGATLEFLSGRELPSIAGLTNK